jgi:predicted nuclease with TOPRIM domain
MSEKCRKMGRKGKRERMREAFRNFVEEFVNRDILKDSESEDLGEKLEEGEDLKRVGFRRRKRLGEVEEVVKACRCGAREDEDCICYFYNKRRAEELKRKLGEEKFRKKQLVDELTQILIEYDC